MDIQDLVALQRAFDLRRTTTFPWSQSISSADSSALTHNALALAGEVGEIAELVKKFDRGDYSFEVVLEKLPSEIADVLVYLMKLAYQSGIDIEKAFLDKLEDNESRFPASVEIAPSESSVSWDFRSISNSDLVSNIDSWANRLTSVARSQEVDALSGLFHEVKVHLPDSIHELFGGALLGVALARTAEYEGWPVERERVWSRLVEPCRKYGFDRDDIERLSRSDVRVNALAESILAHPISPE